MGLRSMSVARYTILALLLTGCYQVQPQQPERIIRPEGVIRKCSVEFNDCIGWTVQQSFESNELLEMAVLECIDAISECM